MWKASKNAVHKQHKILEYQMGWSFCGHFSVVCELFHSRFLFKNVFSWAARNKTAFHKQHKITSLVINDKNLNMHNNEQHELHLLIRWTCLSSLPTSIQCSITTAGPILPSSTKSCNAAPCGSLTTPSAGINSTKLLQNWKNAKAPGLTGVPLEAFKAVSCKSATCLPPRQWLLPWQCWSQAMALQPVCSRAQDW